MLTARTADVDLAASNQEVKYKLCVDSECTSGDEGFLTNDEDNFERGQVDLFYIDSPYNPVALMLFTDDDTDDW